MTTCFQTALPLRIAQRTVFLGVDVVRAMRGCDAETVFSMVDNGELRWVFDISLDQDTRDLRFWAGEILAPENAARQTEDRVIAAIIGAGATIRRGEIERQWVCSSQHVMRLIRAGEIHLASLSHVSRASVAAFLRRRLVATKSISPDKGAAPHTLTQAEPRPLSLSKGAVSRVANSRSTGSPEIL